MDSTCPNNITASFSFLGRSSQLLLMALKFANSLTKGNQKAKGVTNKRQPKQESVIPNSWAINEMHVCC